MGVRAQPDFLRKVRAVELPPACVRALTGVVYPYAAAANCSFSLRLSKSAPVLLEQPEWAGFFPFESSHSVAPSGQIVDPFSQKHSLHLFQENGADIIF